MAAELFTLGVAQIRIVIAAQLEHSGVPHTPHLAVLIQLKTLAHLLPVLSHFSGLFVCLKFCSMLLDLNSKSWKNPQIGETPFPLKLGRLYKQSEYCFKRNRQQAIERAARGGNFKAHL